MKHFQPDDLCRHRKVLSLTGAVEAPAVFGAVREVDRDADAYRRRVWRFDASGEAGALTAGPGDDWSPMLSPSGHQLAFISTRTDTPQVYVMPAAGGDARRIGDFDSGVSDVRWAADDRTLLVAAAVPVDPERQQAAAPAPGQTRGPRAPEVCWRLPYKADGMGYLLARRVRLHAVDVATGAQTLLAGGDFDVLGFACSPDGRHIAYVRTSEGRFAHRSELWVCRADGAEHRLLTRELATIMQPAWSPDGRALAFAGALEEGDAQARLWRIECEGGAPARLDDEAEVADPTSLHFDAQGHLHFVQAWRGRHRLVSRDTDGNLHVEVEGDRQFGATCPVAGGWAIAAEEPTQPCEVWLCMPGREDYRLGELNAWWAERTPLVLQSRRFAVPDGRGGTETIEGWLLRARGGKGPCPLLVDAHGGPASYALLDYDTNVYWQTLCSRGWAVLALNTVGSSSFGGEFCRRLSGHWGELDLPQYLAVLDALRHEGIGAERTCIAGKSYGGYLTAWATGHTEAFDAAVVMAPVGNVETHYGTSDGGYYADPLYMDTEPGFDRTKARALSPLQSIEHSTTPTLFLQGKEDERCPKCQSEELFVSLYNVGHTPCELVLYPDEGHLFLGEGRPACRIDAAERIIRWLQAPPRGDARTSAALDPSSVDLARESVAGEEDPGAGMELQARDEPS